MPVVDRIHSGVEAQVFRHSLDWRFLLPLEEGTRLHVLAPMSAELTVALDRAGIVASAWSDHGSLPHDFDHPVKGELDVLALPIGIPNSKGAGAGSEPAELYEDIRQHLRAGGYLLIGFENRLLGPWIPSGQYQTSTPARMRRSLAKAGFSRIEFFGVSPNLDIPEYILHLRRPAIEFALRHRFRRTKLLRVLLDWLLRASGALGIPGLFPCYYVVAAA